MQGAAVQCCMCIVGVFMFLGGVIMLATGISLILNYGVFDIELLPPDLNNEEGKKTVGIILAVCGFLAIIVSVIVSLLYLCNKTKTSINPDDLSRIPTSSRNNTPDRPEYSRGSNGSNRADRRPVPGKPGAVPNGTHRAPTKNIPGSAEVKIPRSHRKRHMRGHRARKPNRLEEIKEDAISRKTVDAAIADVEYRNETGSFSSQMTLDDNSKIPKVVLDEYHERPSSASSMTTSMTSDTSSNYRFLENDKSRRELQFMPENVRSLYTKQQDGVPKDNVSLGQYDETSLIGNKTEEECSINSEGLINPAHDSSYSRPMNFDNQGPAGGAMVSGSAQSDLPEFPDTDSSIMSYKTSHHTEVHGENTTGRISPQIGEPESYTQVEARKQSSDDDVS